MINLTQIDDLEIEKYVLRSVLEGHISPDGTKALYTGPVGKDERRVIQENPEHAALLAELHKAANYAELLTRFCENMGMVKDAEMIEPGLKQQQASGKVKSEQSIAK